MADNVTINGITVGGGAIIAADELAGVFFQRVKACWGPDGTANDVDDASNKRLPVKLAEFATGLVGTNNALKFEGDVAHDGADAGNPVKIGAKAVALGSSASVDTAGDRTNLIATRAGQLWVQPGHPNIQTLRYNFNTAQTNNAIVTQAAGGRLAVTCITVTAKYDNTQNPAIRIGFGSASTPTTTGVVFSHPGFPSGVPVPSRGDGSGIVGIGGDDEDLRITTDAIGAGLQYEFDVDVTYYVLPG